RTRPACTSAVMTGCGSPMSHGGVSMPSIPDSPRYIASKSAASLLPALLPTVIQQHRHVTVLLVGEPHTFVNDLAEVWAPDGSSAGRDRMTQQEADTATASIPNDTVIISPKPPEASISCPASNGPTPSPVPIMRLVELITCDPPVRETTDSRNGNNQDHAILKATTATTYRNRPGAPKSSTMAVAIATYPARM